MDIEVHNYFILTFGRKSLQKKLNSFYARAELTLTITYVRKRIAHRIYSNCSVCCPVCNFRIKHHRDSERAQCKLWTFISKSSTLCRFSPLKNLLFLPQSKKTILRMGGLVLKKISKVYKSVYHSSKNTFNGNSTIKEKVLRRIYPQFFNCEFYQHYFLRL